MLKDEIFPMTGKSPKRNVFSKPTWFGNQVVKCNNATGKDGGEANVFEIQRVR